MTTPPSQPPRPTAAQLAAGTPDATVPHAAEASEVGSSGLAPTPRETPDEPRAYKGHAYAADALTGALLVCGCGDTMLAEDVVCGNCAAGRAPSSSAGAPTRDAAKMQLCDVCGEPIPSGASVGATPRTESQQQISPRASAAGGSPSEAGAAAGSGGVRAEAAETKAAPFAAEVQYGKHVIRIICPHIEGGACGPCLAVQLVPYLAAKEALTWVLPRLDLLAESLDELRAGTTKLTAWARDRMAESWTLAPGSPVPAPSDPNAVPASTQPAASGPTAGGRLHEDKE